MESLIEEQHARRRQQAPRVGLAWQIVIGLALGVVLGLVLNRYPQLREAAVSNVLQPAGDIFIKLIRMVVVPIIFTSMVVGITGVGNGRALGRIGLKTLIYFELITTLAIILGLVAGNLLHPGLGADISRLGHGDLPSAGLSMPTHHGVSSLVLGLIPENVLGSMSKGDLLPVIFFSVLFGLGLQTLPAESRQPVVLVLKGTADAMFKVTGMVMRYAPIGILALIAATVAHFGFGSLLPLLKLVLITYLALILFAFVVLGITARVFGFSIFTLIRVIKDELIIAFSTCSSATVLPQLMKKIEDYGVPRAISTFVIPTGYSFNLDGVSIYLGIATLFIAQIYGVHLGFSEQIMLTVTMVVTSKGAAGVPGFVLVVLLATLASAGLPVEGLALIAGVDRVMDMGRTALNVLGNALAPLIIAQWEGQYDKAKGAAYVAALDR